MRTGLRRRSPDMLVGADGAHSVVRKAFGAVSRQCDRGLFLRRLSVRQTGRYHFAEITLFDPGVLGRIPVAEDMLRYLSTFEDFETRIAHPEVVAERTWNSQFRIRFRHVETMAKGNVFLAGDAAHVHSPAGARGMNLGIEDACWLAWLVAEGREEDYSALRMPAVKTVLKETWRDTTGHLEKSAGDCHAQSVRAGASAFRTCTA